MHFLRPNMPHSSRKSFRFSSGRPLSIEQLEKRQLLAGDLGQPTMEIRLEPVHPITGAVLQDVPVGGSFLLRSIVDDLRSPGEDLGVFAAYADVHFQSEYISISGPINYGEGFQLARSGDTSNTGLIERIGAVQPALTPPGGEPQTLYEVMMTAHTVGETELLLSASNTTVHSQNLLFGMSNRVDPSSVRFVSASINVVEEATTDVPVGVSDGYSVPEDGILNIDASEGVLSNDFVRTSRDATLYAYSVSPPQHGFLSMNPDGSFQYIPNADYSGADSFQYVVLNDSLSSSVTKVVIDVAPEDDAPVTQPDHYIVRPGSTLKVDATRGLLANDQEVDGQELSVRLFSESTVVDLELLEDGSFLFRAPETMVENIVLEYDASDGQMTTRETLTFQANNGGEQEDWGTLGYVINQRLAVVDSKGKALNQVPAGGEFFVEVYAQDLRETPTGVFSAYLDLTFDGELASAFSPIQYGEVHKYGSSGDISAGFIDELGAFSGSTSVLDGSEFLIARVPFQAQGPGTIQFTADSSDLQQHEPLLYGEDFGISPQVVRYGDASVEILEGVLAADDTYELLEDTTSELLQVLANDVSSMDTDMRIVGVSPSASGASVSIAPDGLSVIYSGKPNYFGTDSFSYVVEDSSARRGEARVSIKIENLNDAPDVVDDTFTIKTSPTGGAEGEALQTQLDVLANDSPEPDLGESLTIIGVSDSDGLLTISEDGATLQLNHGASPLGTQTFTYQVSDGNGGLGSATVTIKSEEAATSVWQNPENHLDVSNDGIVSPIDVLIVVNRLNRLTASGVLTDADLRSADNNTIYVDTNGDRAVSPIDVLSIVNYLNSRTGEGEGEHPKEPDAELSWAPSPLFVGPTLNLNFIQANTATKENSIHRANKMNSKQDADELLGPIPYQRLDVPTASLSRPALEESAAELVESQEDDDWFSLLAEADTEIQRRLTSNSAILA
ncbi:MAG: hypothetical protein Aurels2KO_49240 [Aureliella sp.]